jgi:hypothetical protein
MDRSTQPRPDQEGLGGEASHLASTARDEAGRVADEAKRQGRELYHEAAHRARQEAQLQTSRAANGIRSFSQDLRSMTEGQTNAQSPAVDWIRQGSRQIESFADHVDRRGIDGLMDDVNSFARRNPGTFLAVTFGAGVMAARVLRNMSGDNGHRTSADSEDSGSQLPDEGAFHEDVQPGEAAGSPPRVDEDDFSREEYPR